MSALISISIIIVPLFTALSHEFKKKSSLDLEGLKLNGAFYNREFEWSSGEFRLF